MDDAFTHNSSGGLRVFLRTRRLKNLPFRVQGAEIISDESLYYTSTYHANMYAA